MKEACLGKYPRFLKIFYQKINLDLGKAQRTTIPLGNAREMQKISKCWGLKKTGKNFKEKN